MTKPIEDELSSISHFKQVRSATRPGRAEIFVELDSQADADMVAIEATKKVSRIRKNLPEDIDEPAVLKRSSEEYPIIQIAATSKDNLDDIFALADSSFKERLQQAAGVADVDVTGGRTKEVAIEVDKDKLNYYGLTLQDIITAVRKENVIVSSGSVYTDALEKTVRLQAQYKAPEEIQHLQLKGAGGRYIELGQVANVQAKDKRAVAYSRVDGNEAVSLEVYKASGANIVDTADGVLQQLETLRKDKKLVDFVRFIWKPGIWFDKFCVVRFVKAVNRKRLRTVFHKIVPQLMCQGRCQHRDTRGVEVYLCAQLLPVVNHSRIRRFADRIHIPAERGGKISLIAPIERIAAELFGAKIGQRRLVIRFAVR